MLMLDHALYYASMGWHIFPLHTPDKNGVCSCRKECHSSGKHPRVKDWQEAATTNEAQIRYWWKQWPDANIGLAVGKSGLFVVDQDGQDGAETIASYGGFHTVTAATGKGHHYYFKLPQEAVGNKVRFAPGLDTRAKGGLVVLPPSLHYTGRHYEWVEGQSPEVLEVAQLPSWVINAIARKDAPAHGASGTSGHNGSVPFTPKDAVEDARQALQRLHPSRCDNYQEWLNVGMALHELGLDGLLLWDNWSQQSAKYTPGCCTEKWKTFKNEGITLKTLFHSANIDSPPTKGYNSNNAYGSGYNGNNGHGGHNGYSSNGNGQGNGASIPPFPPEPPYMPETEQASTVDPHSERKVDMYGPAMSKEVQWVYRHDTEAGEWVNQYLAFACDAAPMTPRVFHEAAALFILSSVVARRLVIYADIGEFYPNLYMMFLAPSTIHHKSTGFNVLKKVVQAARLQHYFLPEQLTPQALMQEMSLSVPAYILSGDKESYNRWLDEHAFAAQRGWMLDEASSFFDGLKRDYQTGMLTLFLALHDCPEEKSEQTISRGRVRVKNAYLSFFGASTPIEMAEHLNNPRNWTNGLWARCAIITPQEGDKKEYKFFGTPKQVPQSLSDGLRRIAGMFPTPVASIIETESANGAKIKVVDIQGAEEPSEAILDEDARQAWARYCKCNHDLCDEKGGRVDEKMLASYGRFNSQIIKVAMLLALADADSLPIRINIHHYARAQYIVEQWREMLHGVSNTLFAGGELSDADKIMKMIEKAEPDGGLKARDIYRPLNKGSKEVRPILDELVKQGRLDVIKVKATNGRMVEVWRLAK